MKTIDFLEKRGIMTGEVLKIFSVVVVSYVYSLAMLHTHNYILGWASSLWVLGGLGNLYVISFNKNRMPVPVASRTVGAMRKKYPKRGICKLTNRTRLGWLADRILVHNGYYSVGDFLILSGVILMLLPLATAGASLIA